MPPPSTPSPPPDASPTPPAAEVPSSPTPPELSVVVVVGGLRERAAPCLSSLLGQGLGDRLEVLLLDRGRPGAEPVAGSESPRVRVIPQAPDATYSQMRVVGVEAAAAPVVAFVEEHVRVRPGWAEALLAAFAEGWDAVGAAVVVANPGVGDSDLVGLVSYGRFYPPAAGGEAEMLPGHNASYRAELLRALGDELEPLLHGDLELQQRLRADGRRLTMAPGAVIEHLCETEMEQLARGLHLWYRCYGPLRAHRRGWSRLRRAAYVLATPLIPVYFLLRFARHLRRRRSPHLGLLLRRAPAVYRLHLHAATGQALGLLFGEGDALARFTDYELHEPRPEAEEISSP